MEFRKINFGNIDEVMALTVREDQEGFVAPNVESLAEAYVAVSGGYWAQPFGIYEEDRPVGFVMFGYGSLDDPDEPEVAKGNYCLWRFMIGREHQGRGLGKQAMELCLDYLRTMPRGDAQAVWLSYEPENAVARSLYEKAGFRENGQMCGREVVAVLNLSRSAGQAL